MSNPKQPKIRLDHYLVEQGFVDSRNKAQALILAGEVLVNDEPVTKAGTLIKSDVAIRLKTDPCPFVSRGGYKLMEALEQFELSVQGRTCLDAGASTGGFTDCLLQHGAAQVLAVDVGHNQLAWSLRQDERVISLEKTNIRHLESGFQQAWTDKALERAVCDVSFISLKKVLPVLCQLVKPTDSWIVALIKPQFECRDYLNAEQLRRFDGVIHDDDDRQQVVDGVLNDLQATLSQLTHPWQLEQTHPSPIRGPKGNTEILSLWTPNTQ